MKLNKIFALLDISKIIRRVGLIIMMLGLFEIGEFRIHRLFWCIGGAALAVVGMFISSNKDEER